MMINIDNQTLVYITTVRAPIKRMQTLHYSFLIQIKRQKRYAQKTHKNTTFNKEWNLVPCNNMEEENKQRLSLLKKSNNGEATDRDSISSVYWLKGGFNIQGSTGAN